MAGQRRALKLAESLSFKACFCQRRDLLSARNPARKFQHTQASLPNGSERRMRERRMLTLSPVLFPKPLPPPRRPPPPAAPKRQQKRRRKHLIISFFLFVPFKVWRSLGKAAGARRERERKRRSLRFCSISLLAAAGPKGANVSCCRA